MHIIMTNHNSTLVAGLRTAAFALTLTGAAFAGELSPGTIAFNTADANDNGSLDLTEFTTTLAEGTKPQKAARDFKKADTDKDALISLTEYRTFIGELQPPTKEEISFDAANTDVEDLGLSLEEFADTFKGNTAPIEIIKRFLKADADENDFLSLEEWTLYKKGKAKGPEGAKYYKFDLADRDNDARLYPAEFALTFSQNTKEATIVKKFVKEDADESGYLTRDEWNPGAPKQAPVL